MSLSHNVLEMKLNVGLKSMNVMNNAESPLNEYFSAPTLQP